ncbi:MAG: glutamate mutase L [Blautia sp.]
MKPILLVDFGSTNTKVTAVDVENCEILGTAAAYTTVETDINNGLHEALKILEKTTGPLEFSERYACSSAAGGLKMISIGLVPELTAKASREASLGAGAKVWKTYSFNLTKGDMREVVLVQEAYQERRIGEIARQIADRKDVRFVLIAGPSSSGKTTFSHRLSIQLRVNGLKPHPIAVDNYFVDREHTPKDSDGNYDFECLEAIDIPKFNEDMRALLKGEEVYLPIFDFKSGKRKYESKPKKLGSQDILVIEGIHCLNPKLTETMADANKFKIYISALTQLNIDEHNRIPTTDGRLIRRIVRDSRTRGASASKTISMWASVRRGEEKNIFPFQEEADVMFNSSLIYELAVLKQYVEPLLFAVDKDSKEFIEAKRLLKFFDYFVGIGSEFIPTNSLLREFVGGGCFRL